MDNLMLQLEQWALNEMGIKITASLHRHIQEQVEALIADFSLEKEVYFNQLYHKDTAAYKATVDILTVQESYFFRDITLFNYLEQALLPRLIHQKIKKEDFSFTIWSVGCAQGEEIYSIAILLHELIPEITNWHINLLGSDINSFALARAQQGIFSKSNLRGLDKRREEKYFDYKEKYYLKPAIKNLASFVYGNLAKISSLPCVYDLIICRNVFIYLTQDTIRNALNVFYQGLKDEGLLFLGPAETPSYYSHPFVICIDNNIHCLKKAKKSQPIRAPLSKPVAKQTKKLEEIVVTPDSIAQILAKKEYALVLKKIDEYLTHSSATGLIYRYQAEAFMGLNNLEDALASLKRAIQCNTLEPWPYFLKGIVETELKRVSEAMGSLQKALYLNPLFPEAAYYLGLLYLQINKKEQAMKFLRQSLSLANKMEKNSILYTQDTKEQFIQAISATIAYYKEEKDV